MGCYVLCIYMCVCVRAYLFDMYLLIFLLFFCLSNVDMDNNDVIYYSIIVHNIVGAISFLCYLQNKFDREHGFHPSFIDDHICVLDETKTHVK